MIMVVKNYIKTKAAFSIGTSLVSALCWLGKKLTLSIDIFEKIVRLKIYFSFRTVSFLVTNLRGNLAIKWFSVILNAIVDPGI